MIVGLDSQQMQLTSFKIANMEKMRNFLKHTILMLGMVSIVMIVSCGEEEPLEVENEIVDGSGLKITLEWSTGGSVSQSMEEVDLDLDLIFGDEAIDSSSSSFSFESVDLSSFFSDGNFDVVVEYFRGSVNVDYTIFVEGASTGEILEYEGIFAASDAGLTITDISIIKDGNVYTIVD